ncbi:MAG: hypothetical protein WB780_22140 [Candidatus Acidiferrales bacterium]
MQSHLDTGCKGCAKLFTTWKRVQEAGRREASYQPPDSVVRSVKGAGVIHGLGQGRPAKAPIAELLFDSMRNPMAAGVRSSSANLRQLLYGVGGYRLDLRIEPRENSDKVDLVGQILNSADPEKPVGVTPVVLKKGNRVMAESVTNRFGEFQLECDLAGSLELHADLPHGQVVHVPLVELVSGTSAKEPQPDDSIGLKRLLHRIEKRTRKKV